MFTVLFWNVGGQDRAEICARLAHRHNVDALFLAECPRPIRVHRALNNVGESALYFAHPANDCRVISFTRLERTEFPAIEVARHYSIHRLTCAGAPRMLVAAVHFPSKLRTSDDEQERHYQKFAAKLDELELAGSHTRTLVIGDLNAHPYQRGIFSADALHGVPTRAIASRGHRVVAGKKYKMFFNPMWRFFGDRSPGPPGTYYRWRAEHDCAFWYMFDQVLLRPDLLPYFSDDGVEILTTDGEVSFLRPDGTPNPEAASDHLPILLRLDYPGVH